MVCRLIWFPVEAVFTASKTSISPFLGQTEGSVVHRAGLGGGLVVNEGGTTESHGLTHHVPQPNGVCMTSKMKSPVS